MKNSSLTLTFAVILMFVAGISTAGADIIYVDAVASTGGDGQTWGTAYKYLQDALYKPPSGGDQIWVAAGTYKPDEDEGGNVTLNDRYATFQLYSGVALYGGLAGTEDPATFNLADRDFETNETILSGDIGTVGDNSDNSYHVVTGSGTDATAVLDGFTITAGNADASSLPHNMGGGMYNESGSPTLSNCTFSVNSARSSAGMRNTNNSSPTLTNCTFSGNSATDNGGGMYNGTNSSPTLTNCTFSGNYSVSHDGGGMYNHDSSPTLTNCTFIDNIALTGSGRGGGMFNFDNSPILTNCTFSGNSAEYGGGMWNSWSSSPTLTNCTFSGNSAVKWGGGMFNSYNSSPTLTNCTFSVNSASRGGGMWNDYSSPIVTNCTFSGNSAELGGGMLNYWYSSPTITNCTFSGNSAGGSGGGMQNYNSSSLTVTNCIMWGDSAPSGPEISNDGTSSATVSYSDVQGGWIGTGNIDAVPLFVDADGPDDIVGTEDDNLRLLVGSLCIDAGDNSAVPAGVTTDLDGNPRIVAGIVDMGAFEAPLLDPIALLLELTQQVIELNIQQGILNSLDAKLQAVIQALEDANENNDVAAINALEAFINAVQAQRGNKIPEADADALIATAQEAIAALSSS